MSQKDDHVLEVAENDDFFKFNDSEKQKKKGGAKAQGEIVEQEEKKTENAAEYAGINVQGNRGADSIIDSLMKDDSITDGAI